MVEIECCMRSKAWWVVALFEIVTTQCAYVW